MTHLEKSRIAPRLESESVPTFIGIRNRAAEIGRIIGGREPFAPKDLRISSLIRVV